MSGLTVAGGAVGDPLGRLPRSSVGASVPAVWPNLRTRRQNTLSRRVNDD